MTSMLKRVDVAVYNTIGDYLEGKAKVGTDPVFDLKVDGVGYSTTGGNLEDIKSQARRSQAADHRRQDHGSDRSHRSDEPDVVENGP